MTERLERKIELGLARQFESEKFGNLAPSGAIHVKVGRSHAVRFCIFLDYTSSTPRILVTDRSRL